MDTPIELGVDTFGDVTVDESGQKLHPARVIRNVVEEAVTAERVGLDFFGIGEHHRDDFAVSAPEIVLAAIAGRTERIKLGTSVTVLSSDDPVRVFQRFSTLDAVSNGRAEVILGRGSFTESFPLFGLDLADYNQLFEEKLDLFAHLLEEGPVTWSGTVRAGLDGQVVQPPTEHGLRAWIGVGGSPESVVRAARYGMPLMLAIIGGSPVRFTPLVDLYHRALEQLGRPRLPVGAHLPGHIAETDRQALDELWPHQRVMHARIGAERGWPPMTREQFEMAAGPEGPLMAGSPETVTRKLIAAARDLSLDRIQLKLSGGTLPHESITRSIELFGREVAPAVREAVAQDRGGAVTSATLS